MTIRSAKTLRENLATIKADNERRLEVIQKRIADFEERHVSTEGLKRELAQAQAVARRSEELAEKQLKVAEDRELKETQANEETRKRLAAEIESRSKFRAERTWIAAGGDPKEFETAWPALREKLLENAVIQTNSAPERTQVIHSL